MPKNEFLDYDGEITVEVKNHGIITPWYFGQRNKFIDNLAKPKVKVKGVPHLNNGEETETSLNQGTVGDCGFILSKIHPNSPDKVVDLINDQGSKQSLREGRFFEEKNKVNFTSSQILNYVIFTI